MNEWLWCLTGVWNWAVRKIEQDAKGGVYYTPFDFRNILQGHSEKVGISSHTLQGVLESAHAAWSRCFKKIARKPRLKGNRNRMSSIPFPDPIRSPQGNRIRLPILGSIRFHKQDMPEGRIKCGRLVRRASGWHLCLVIDAPPNAVPQVSGNAVGIDPGFKQLLTLSSGEKIDHPRELERGERRLAQAQRGKNKRLTARLQERLANRRKDRNHKLSRRLVAENALICFSADNHRSVAKRFGKSVSSSGHGQLRAMISYKCRAGGRDYREVSPQNSTRICSNCGSLTGPTGWAGLSVRAWVCADCGMSHDRDVNAAVNTLMSGVGTTPERIRHVV